MKADNYCFEHFDINPSNWIRDARRALGLTQAALGRALGVDTSTVAHWEQGRNKPPRSAFLALAGMLEKS